MINEKEMLKEMQIVLAIAIFLSLVTIIPFFAGYFSAGDHVYLGLENIPDGFTYMGYLKSNMVDNVLISKNFTTHEAQLPTLPNMYFAAVALTAKATGISMEILYVAFKTILLIPFVFILWRFLKDYFFTAKQRIVSLVLILFGGGLGWILFGLSFINPWFGRFDSTGLKYPYLNNLFGSFHHPLVFLSLAFMMIGFIILKKAIKENSLRHALMLNLAILSVYFIHPVDILIFVGVLGMMLLIYKRDFIWTIFPGIAYVGLHTTLARSDMAYQLVQNIYFTWYKMVHPAFLPVVFGVLFFLFVLELRKFNLEDKHKTLLILWGVSSLILGYVIPAGIKMTGMAFIPVFILGLHSFFTFSKKVKYALVVFILLGAPIILYDKISDQMSPRSYLSQSDAGLLEKIKNDTGLVLVPKDSAGVLLLKTNLRPLFLDRYTTIDYLGKQADSNHFFEGKYVKEAALKYNPSYVLSKNSLSYSCLDELFVSESYYYYRIHPERC